MRKRLIVIIALLVGAVVLGGWVWVRRRQAALTSDLQTYYQQLHHPDARVRLRAAEGVLRIDPTHPEALPIQADALITLGRFSQARWVLNELALTFSHPGQERVLRLYAESCFREVADWVSNSTLNAVDQTQRHCEALLTEAGRILTTLEGLPNTEAIVAQFRARRAYARVGLMRLELRVQAQGYEKAKAVGHKERLAELEGVVSGLASRVEALEQRLLDHCQRLIEIDPQDPLPRQLRFEMYIDARLFDRAREVAQELAGLDRLDASLVGAVGHTLLNLDTRFAQWVTPDDVAVVRSLVEHPDLIGDDDLNYRLAQTHLALCDEDYLKAEQLAKRLLKGSWFHPKGMCLLSLALVKQGYAQEAVELLIPLDQKVKTPMVKYTLGVSFLGAGQTEQGHEWLRQCIELEPRYLPARLALAQSLVGAGHVLEAEPDITQAIELSPNHPAVIKLQIQLLIEQMDRRGLLALLEDRLSRVDTDPIQWQDVAMVGAMALDEVGLVQRLVDQRLENDSGEWLAVLGRCWLGAYLDQRLEVSALVVRVLLEHVDRDPMQWPMADFVAAVADSSAGHLEAQAALDRPGISRYLPSNKELMLDLVEVSMLEWPQAPMLGDLAARLSFWLGEHERAQWYIDRLVGEAGQLSAPIQRMRAYFNKTKLELPQALVGLTQLEQAKGSTYRLIDLADALDRQDDRQVKQHIMAMVSEQGWPQLAVWWVIRDALRKGLSQEALVWLGTLQHTNPKLGLISQAQLNLAIGQPVDAMHDLKSLLQEEDRASEVSRIATELLARANVRVNQRDIAAGLFEDLVLSLQSQRIAVQVAALDVLLEAQEHSAAVAMVKVLLDDADLSQRWVDRLLVRAQSVMQPDRLHTLLDQLIQRKGRMPLLLWYKAHYAADVGDWLQAGEILSQVLEVRPLAPRAIMLQAQIATAQGQLKEAAHAYNRLLKRGGFVGWTAYQQLQGLAKTKPSTSTKPAVAVGQAQ